eukprot:TRINITY_DN22846_c0_g1_i1.p2 TRINITY_DN22846_c0_g1~~TRINITY_DN22846_c0_g1_i1.p2  ORF type:complete len:118 (+),score=28.85 TRINITY_DN22846_c0_g1_i1:49-402(+)
MLRRAVPCLYNVTNPKVMIDLCIVPMKHQDGVSVSKEIAAVERLIRSSGLKTQLHAYGTNIEGPWDEVFALVKRCHLLLHNEHGVPRISTNIKCGTRLDKESTIEGKVQSVEDKLKA